jgi:cell wall-associated NlpC family hydrolase
MFLDGLGSSAISPRFPSEVGGVGAPATPEVGLPDAGGAEAFGFSGESDFEAAAPVDGSRLAAQRVAPRGVTNDVAPLEGPSALSALSGQSDFEASSTPRTSERTQAFLREALSQNGKPYVFGAEASPTNANPKALDCSELVEWASTRAGVPFPDGSANQIDAARPLSVEQALRTPGALLYRPGHIAISLGDGRTIEARNRKAGVGIFDANNRGWTRAGTIPGLE